MLIHILRLIISVLHKVYKTQIYALQILKCSEIVRAHFEVENLSRLWKVALVDVVVAAKKEVEMLETLHFEELREPCFIVLDDTIFRSSHIRVLETLKT